MVPLTNSPEETEPRPVSLYAETKVDSEIVLQEARSATFHPVILRLATVFGLSNRPRFDLAVNLLTAKACSEGVITIFNGQSWRPFIHVQDVSRAFMHLLALHSAQIGTGVFNVGDSRMNYRIADVGEKIRSAISTARIETVAVDDARNYRVSFDRISRVAGFQSSLTLEDGIDEIRTAVQSGSIRDCRDIYYDNQKCLEHRGSPVNEDELDQRVMAAFSVGPKARVAVAS